MNNVGWLLLINDIRAKWAKWTIFGFMMTFLLSALVAFCKDNPQDNGRLSSRRLNIAELWWLFLLIRTSCSTNMSLLVTWGAVMLMWRQCSVLTVCDYSSARYDTEMTRGGCIVLKTNDVGGSLVHKTATPQQCSRNQGPKLNLKPNIAE